MNQEFKNVTLETYPKYFDALCERVAVDADLTFQLEEVLQAEVNKPGNESLRKVYDTFIMPVASFLSRVEQNGMLVNEDLLLELDKQYEVKLDDILREIEDSASQFWDRDLYLAETDAKSAPVKFNPGSPKQMSWMVFDRLKLKPKRRKGRSTDADVLESIDTDLPLIKKVLEYRGVQKEKSTYVVGTLKLRDIDGRVRTNFSLHITATGRLSSKEPNVQNVPSANGVGNIRRAYLPREGYVLLEVDYSGAELRWLAFLSQDRELLKIFKSGRNLHKETATKIYGPHYTPQQKMRAKAVNFGIPYGREAASFKDEFGITMEEAQEMIDGWLNAYPDARDYLQWCADQVLAGRYLQTPWGNRRRAGLVTPESLHNLQNEFKNFPIQGSSSHTLVYSGLSVEQHLLTEYNTYIIDLIHDSMLLEVPKDKDTVLAVAKYVDKVMVDTPIKLFNCNIPFKTDTDIGPDWGSLEALNKDTGMIEFEEDNGIREVPYEEWIESVYHYDIYQRSWYKNLQQI
jgi:DNA polymerase-1